MPYNKPQMLDISIKGATGILFNIVGSTTMTMQEVDEAAKIIIESASSDANIIFGTSIDEQMDDQIKITVIATGFEQEDIRTKLGISSPTAHGGYRRPDYGSHTPVMQNPLPQQPEEEPEVTKDEPEQQDNSWGEPSIGNDLDSKYDIPAFLRGK